MANPLGTKIGSAFFEVSAAFTGFGESFETGVLASVTQAGATLGSAMENLGKELFKRFTIPFGIAAAANVAQFAQLERAVAETLTLFGTAPSLVDNTFDAMSAGITRVSREVGGLEKDLADGLYQTISAGVDRDDAFDFLSVAQTAAIADKTADVATAVDGLTTSVNAFGLEAHDVGRVADVMFATVAQGKTTFGELSTDIGRVAPLAANAGASLEETYAILGQLTKQGLQTSEAVSYLRGAITGLLRPGDDMNKIFADLGFASAEAAIPVLGLQGAFQAVESASGGSVSRLQELLGVAEGVNAVLGVTGDNADSFASVLSVVESSAGATANAYKIVDQTVSRSFGKMTESFDRLGNLFGSMAAEFAQPVVDTVTDIVDGVADVFKNLIPIARNVGSAFAALMSVFDNPVVRGLAVAVASIVLAFGGLLGVVGALLVPMGKLIFWFFQLATVQKIVSGLGAVLELLRIKVVALGNAFINMGNYLVRSMIPATTALGRAFQALGAAMAKPIVAFGVVAAAIIAVTVAIAGGIYLWSKWRDAQREAHEQNQTFTVGVDRLAESLGIAGTAIGFMAKEMDGLNGSESDFRLVNQALINEIGQIADRVGDAAAQDYILSIGAQLQFQGATPEEALAAVQRLAAQAGITLDIDTTSFLNNSKSIETYFKGIEASAQSVQNYLNAQGLGQTVALTGEAASEADNLAQALAQAYVFASNTDQLGAFKNLAYDMLSGVTNAEVMNTVLDKSYGIIEDLNGQDLDVSTSKTDNLDDWFREMETFGTVFEDIKKEVEQPIQVQLPVVGSTETDLEDFQKKAEGAVQWTEAQVDTITDLRFSIDEVLKAGTDSIEESFSAIKAGMLEQMPLLSVYEGAIDQTFAAWKKGQQQFVEDIAAVTVVRDKLIEKFGEGSDLVKAFDSEPLSSQAWLAQLGAKELEEAMGLLADSQTAALEAATERTEQDMTVILADAQTAMNDKYMEMAEEAGEAGRIVADTFDELFSTEAGTWSVSAQTAWDSINAIMAQPISGPTVGPIQWSGTAFGPSEVPGGDSPTGFSGGNVEVNVFNPSVNSLTGDTERAAGIVRSARLGGRLE